MTLTNRHGSGFGKSLPPQIPQEPNIATDLTQFEGTDLLAFFFLMLKLDLDFLSAPSSEWSFSKKYNSAKEVADAICVENDAAERGVKLCCDYINSTHNRWYSHCEVLY